MKEYDSTDTEEDIYEAATSDYLKDSDHSRSVESDIISSDSEVGTKYNLSASYIQSESDAEKSYNGNNITSNALSDSSIDIVAKKPTRIRNVIDSDSDDEIEDRNVSDQQNENHSKLSEKLYDRKTELFVPAQIDCQSVVEESNAVGENGATCNIHDKDTTDLQKKIADISTELSRSKLSDTESNETKSEGSHKNVTNIKGTVTPKCNRLRISDEFKFENFGNNDLLHSTLVDHQVDTPVNSSSGKRLLNKSIDTPRVIKISKESNTPTAVNTPYLNPTSRFLNLTKEANTPRTVKPIIPSRSPSPEIHTLDDEDIIDISSEDENVPRTSVKTFAKSPMNRIQKQTTLDNMFLKKELPTDNSEQGVKFMQVSQRQFQEQQDKVKVISSDFSKATNVLRTINIEHLPDKGKSILNRHKTLENMLLEETKKLSTMKVDENSKAEKKVDILSWDEIEAKANAVQPKTFGKQAMSTYNAQKAVTMDRLQQLHGSLETRPKESDFIDDPKGLKVELMLHQRRALAWLMWRETQKPSGGILADDMGLGKTLTMISLMLKTNEIKKDQEDESEEENEEDTGKSKKKKYNGGTLVVCPASLINQWSSELERRTKRGLASYEMYHGAKRETKPKRLAQHDMVITTYAIVNNECDKEGAIFRVKWRRIIIDEAHQIRNHKSQTSEAVCQLSAKSRWALTGTPVQNKELDMYALLKFLRCTPFDDLMVWKRWVGDKSTGGTERLHTVISSLMLRRTKAELIEKGSLNSLPERKWELIPVNLSKPERDVYSKILIFSRTLFAHFLHQKAEKNTEVVTLHSSTNKQLGPNQEYFQMRQKLLRMNNIKDVKQHEILVLLLRLRQICCHPSLITGMLQEDMEFLGDEDALSDKANALDFLDQLNNLTLTDDAYKPVSSDAAEGVNDKALGLKEAARGVLNPSDPIFSKDSMSSKIATMLKVLCEKVLPKKDKAIIVSQWSSYLNLISHHLRKEGIIYEQLDGTVPVNKRMAMVDRFNDPKDTLTVLLLSLTAGGVGLNLVGGNHLFLLDLHWNPQLENQAQDRIYRMGQCKPVFVYKFMATDTIENRILELQEKKLSIANSMLTGSKQVISSKLSLQDLKMLFEM